MNVDLVKEAEKIVSKRAEPKPVAEKKRDSGFDILLNVVMALSCVTLGVVLALNLI